MTVTGTGFYITGGTLPRDSPSYVRRQADIALYADLQRSEFCYLLTSRQTGKSSLMVRTTVQLRREGVDVVVLDLTAIGQNLTVEQWYFGILGRMGRQLGLEAELEQFWFMHNLLSPLQRWCQAIEEVVLAAKSGRVVIFVDEIDAVRSLAFPTDEFFAAIRAFYNRRAEEAQFRRLVFCLIGVARPSDLIRDARMTPFNIGSRIDLHDFTAMEAAGLAEGLQRKNADAILKRVLYWTGGHPYLTQRLCRSVSDDTTVQSPADVDRLCDRLFFASQARENDDNLLFVGESLLRSEQDAAALLLAYHKILSRRRRRYDSEDAQGEMLQLSGICRVCGECLLVRNRIYQRVFDRRWIWKHMPGAEMRRQRTAFWRGVLRTAAVFAIFLAMISSTAWIAVRERRHADQKEQETSNLLFFADMNLAQQALERHNVERVIELLEFHRIGNSQNFLWNYLWKQCHRERLTCAVNKNVVYAVGAAPDGKRFATGESDGRAQMWDSTTGQHLFTLAGHSDNVNCIAFSPDGRWVATGSSDRTIRLWNAMTGQLAHSLKGHHDNVTCAAFSADGKMLVTGSLDSSVKLWVTGTGDLLRSLPQPSAVQSIGLSPNGLLIAIGSQDGFVRYWDTVLERSAAAVRCHSEAVTGISFSRDGQWLATASNDHTVKLWDAVTRRPIRLIEEGTQSVYSIAFSPDGKKLAIASGDSSVRIWDIDSAHLWQTIEGHTRAVNCVRFAPDGSWLVTGSWDETAKIWDLTTHDTVPLAGTATAGSQYVFSSDGNRLAATVPGNSVLVWEAATGRILANGAGEGSAQNIAAFAPKDRLLALAEMSGRISLCDLSGRTARRVLKAPRMPLCSLALSSNGLWMAAGDNKGHVLLWNLHSGAPPKILAGHKLRVTVLAFSHDNRRLITGSWDYTAKIWNLENIREPPLTLSGHKKTIYAAAFSLDNRIAATGSEDTTIKLWDTTTGREGMTLAGHGTSVDAIVFCRRDHLLKSVGRDGIIRLWRAPFP